MLLLAVIAGCASTPRPNTNSDPSVDFTRFKTFGFIETPATDRGGYETRIDQYTEGTLHIDVVDAGRNTLVWEGSVAGRITDEVIANLEKSIDKGVRIILSEFPVAAGS